MKPVYRVITFLTLGGGYALLFFDRLVSSPLIYGRLLAFFMMGAVMALFIQGPQYGTMQPVSTRPIMVALGVIMMGAGLVWSFVIRNHL